jgi:glycosyltransferase involved in cell wall biosynthesis
VSRFVAETTRTLLSLDGRPIEILPNSVNTSLFRPMPAEPETEGLILFVGRVVEKKGVRQLIQAMPQIIAAVPHARLWIFGGDGRDPTTGRSLTDLLQGLVSPGYRDRIVFKGTIENSQLPALIARAQVCVYPSHMEAQGIVILEGMAMGKPVVASRTGPGPELVKDGVSGLLCDPFDPVSIADKVITLLRDKGLRQRLGAQASRNVGEHFSTAVLVGRNEEFYDRCLR